MAASPRSPTSQCGRDAIRLNVGALSGMTASTVDGQVVAELGVAAVAQPVDAGPRCAALWASSGTECPVTCHSTTPAERPGQSAAAGGIGHGIPHERSSERRFLR
jgi:hypothetical protein